MPRVFIPASLRRLAGGESSIDVDARTVREVVDALEARFPGMRDRLCAEGRLRPAISVVIDSRISALGLLESVSPECEVHFLSSVSGG